MNKLDSIKHLIPSALFDGAESTAISVVHVDNNVAVLTGEIDDIVAKSAVYDINKPLTSPTQLSLEFAPTRTVDKISTKHAQSTTQDQSNIIRTVAGARKHQIEDERQYQTPSLSNGVTWTVNELEKIVEGHSDSTPQQDAIDLIIDAIMSKTDEQLHRSVKYKCISELKTIRQLLKDN